LDNRHATITLNLIQGLGPARIQQLLSVFGDARSILEADIDALKRVHGIGPKIAESIASWRENTDADKEMELAERAGVSLVLQEDDNYPPLLREIADPPLCLYVRGDRQALAQTDTSLAIVGSRRTTFYGTRTAEHLSSSIARTGWSVVSGLATGIDATAQESALTAGGTTIAVLGSGLNRIYPQENIDLARRIQDQGGALVSEFPMQFPPDRRSFPMRNRIISGLTRGTLVVQAGDKSGSLITANMALEQGRQVFAVPGQIDTPQARGCNQLIKEGAKLVEHAGDILEEIREFHPADTNAPDENIGQSEKIAPEQEESEQKKNFTKLHLSELEDKIVNVVYENGQIDIDTLIATLDAPSSKILTTVVGLEMKQVLRQLPGRRVAAINNSVLA